MTAVTEFPPPLPGRLRRSRSPIGASVRARALAPWLDRDLAAGVVTWRSPAHAARALQLTAERSRRSLAGALERLLRDVDNPDLTLAAVRPCPAQIRDASRELLELSVRLRDGAPVDASAVAQLRALVADGAGPCYRRVRGHALRRTLQAVIREIDVE